MHQVLISPCVNGHPCLLSLAAVILLTYVYAGGVCAEFFGGARQGQGGRHC
jgi:hypothetical protein